MCVCVCVYALHCTRCTALLVLDIVTCIYTHTDGHTHTIIHNSTFIIHVRHKDTILF